MEDALFTSPGYLRVWYTYRWTKIVRRPLKKGSYRLSVIHKRKSSGSHSYKEGVLSKLDHQSCFRRRTEQTRTSKVLSKNPHSHISVCEHCVMKPSLRAENEKIRVILGHFAYYHPEMKSFSDTAEVRRFQEHTECDLRSKINLSQSES